MSRGPSVRHNITRSLLRVLQQSRSIDTAIAEHEPSVADSDRAYYRANLYGVIRHYSELSFVLDGLLDRPIKRKDADLSMLLLSGLYQLHWLSTPSHAVVNESVKVAIRLNKSWARGLINAVLRNALRSDLSARLASADALTRSNHPKWLYERIAVAWPEQQRAIVAANQQQAPMWLRSNRSLQPRAEYQARLVDAGLTSTAPDWPPDALRLDQPQAVEALPGFAQGHCSVQDVAAQCAADYLAPQDGMSVLDLCAAPGGKSAHLLERTPQIELTCIDVDPGRLKRVEETLTRIGASATVLCADATAVGETLGEQQFDRILLDAPCSATGVIRRHPDIKWLREPEDIASLTQLQARMLSEAWSLLAPGGHLLYATCSILPEENNDQIERFTAEHPEARSLVIDSTQRLPSALPLSHGVQILPGLDDADGFYYALLEKQR